MPEEKRLVLENFALITSRTGMKMIPESSNLPIQNRPVRTLHPHHKFSNEILVLHLPHKDSIFASRKAGISREGSPLLQLEQW
jgi:hypothetical protein